MNKSQKRPQFIAGLAAAGGAFCVGNALGWSAPAASRLLDGEQYFPITLDQWSWIASIITLGCAISCLPIGYLMNKFGRKWTMLGLVVPFTIGWALVIWAQNFVMMLIGRMLLGLAGGAFAISSPQYSAEIAEKEVRGALGLFFMLLVSLGFVFSYVIGAVVSVFWMSVICAIFPILFGAIFIFMPESPVYLIVENKEDEARKSLLWLRGAEYDPTEEIEELKTHLSEESSGKVPFSVAIKERSSIYALVIGIGLQFFQQMCMINVILFFSTSIFEAAGVGLSADVSTIIIGSMMFLSSLLCTVVVDRLGRRVLLLISISTMTVTLYALGTFFYIQSVDPEAAKSLGWLPLTSLCVYIFAFPIGCGGVTWLLIGEISPKNIKAVCGPFIGFFSWAMAFLITASFNSIADLFGNAITFWMFATVTGAGIFFMYFIVPETKGKTLAEIEDLLNGNKRN